MDTVGQHTVEDRDDAEFIEQRAPFISVGQLAFLGKGYYFWEDNIDLAHWWGRVHCNSEYVICEGSISVDDDKFLDIVGNPRHHRYLRELKAKFKNEFIREFGTEHVPLATLIEYLIKQNNKPNLRGIFPFIALKAVDDHNPVDKVQFVSGKDNFTSLSPKIIICLKTKNSVILRNFKIVFPEEYVE